MAHCEVFSYLTPPHWCSWPAFAKQLLQMIVNIKEKCELHLQNIVHFETKPPHKSKAKCIAFCRFSTVFELR